MKSHKKEPANSEEDKKKSVKKLNHARKIYAKKNQIRCSHVHPEGNLFIVYFFPPVSSYLPVSLELLYVWRTNGKITDKK